MDTIRMKHEEEKQKLKQSINNEKKLTEEAVKKIFQLMQEKPKGANTNTKSASETKRVEKENKRLELELQKVQLKLLFINFGFKIKHFHRSVFESLI
jgi:uncharacterized tellurite resistance protein B-like protein